MPLYNVEFGLFRSGLRDGAPDVWEAARLGQKRRKLISLMALLAVPVCGLAAAHLWTTAAPIGDPVIAAPERRPASSPVEEARAPVPAPAPAEESVPHAAAHGGGKPSFDVMRVERGGDAVAAGQAPAHAKVELLSDGQPIGQATASAEGDWAVVLDRPLAGQQALSLRSTSPDGAVETSEQSIVVGEVGSSAAPLVALTGTSGPTTILQMPDPEPAAASVRTEPPAEDVPAAAATVAIGTVEYDKAGRLHVTGKAGGGAILRAYLNDTFVGETRAAEHGAYAFALDAVLPPGRYRVRVDALEAGGSNVSARAEVPFEREAELVAAAAAPSGPEALPAEPPADGAPRPGEPRVAIIQSGDSLWRLARRSYGHGLRYTTIYRANQDQIRDPDRIYPGQIFVMPLPEAPRG